MPHGILFSINPPRFRYEIICRVAELPELPGLHGLRNEDGCERENAFKFFSLSKSQGLVTEHKVAKTVQLVI
jgi:hypothetical protein